MTALADALPRPRRGTASVVYDATLIVGGSLLIAALAQLVVRLPFTPVPITGQTLGVLLVGTGLGWLRGGLAVALYLAEIAAGLPFAAEARSGLDVLLLSTPSGGYLWGFMVAALLMGWLAQRGWDRSLRSSISVMLLGSVVIYLVGIPWLLQSSQFQAFIGHAPSLEEGLQAGLYPFVIGDVLKLLIAAGVLPTAWRLVGKRER
ncbi:MAG TPA: biotin transporter BioY [Actinomycetota bacterium]|nr:biotin transporter BioY [Actinomycetota bacterium]